MENGFDETENVVNGSANGFAGLELGVYKTVPGLGAMIFVVAGQAKGFGGFKKYFGGSVPVVDGMEKSFGGMGDCVTRLN